MLHQVSGSMRSHVELLERTRCITASSIFDAVGTLSPEGDVGRGINFVRQAGGLNKRKFKIAWKLLLTWVSWRAFWVPTDINLRRCTSSTAEMPACSSTPASFQASPRGC